MGLRVLATTDIHMQLLGFNYVLDRPSASPGLAGLATLIGNARKEAAAAQMACILIDNGDLLQGSELDTALTEHPVSASHPIVACLSHLGYDTIGLGNHDLDHGLDYLGAVAATLPMPVVATNLSIRNGGAIRSRALLEVPRLGSAKDTARAPRIGILSVLPEATAIWNQEHLRGKATVLPAKESLEREIAALRTDGADIVVLLAHMGIEGPESAESYTDDARSLLSVPGIDAVISGHTHRRLPGDDHTGYRDVDTVRGMLGTRPAVMPGFNASDLAVIDLSLSWQRDGGWRVTEHETALRRNWNNTLPDPAILRFCETAHLQTRAALAQPCGHNGQTIHNFFSLAVPTTTCALVACAKHRLISRGLEGRPEAALPLLATAAAHTAGGRGGPGHFLHLPPGPIFRRHLAALSPYANVICALAVSGADLRHWLENSASVFQQLQPGDNDQPLLQPQRPAFDFDTIFGIDYTIDPTQRRGQRIGSIRYKGVPVADRDKFILATNVFRAAGGGGGWRYAEGDVVLRSNTGLETALTGLLAGNGFPFALSAKPWRFSCAQTVKAVIRSAPDSLKYLREINHLSPQPLGTDAEGFTRIRLTL
ncbi:5'-nucleotidase C-terminal domain-containing protein [Marimonas sp. MJW-29]|uniref:5'-nucleotidase C-terminal domain-containing protein n=1 Tax=Sulfitobacter sediminis TaxID=3234186 RepID=A0ABV3RH82_9RHOB